MKNKKRSDLLKLGQVEPDITINYPAPTAAIQPAYEEVDHPDHYNRHPSGVECITIIEHFTANIAFAVKYLWRAGLKPGTDHDMDLRKALYYIQRERERLAK